MEAGPHTREEPNHIQPARFYSNLARRAKTFTFYEAKPSPALLDRSVVVGTGRALGGGSSVNCMKTVSMIPSDTQTEVVKSSSLLHESSSL